jgi:hypothetical protein
MSGVGHFVMMEDPENSNRLLAETITELEKMIHANKRQGNKRYCSYW